MHAPKESLSFHRIPIISGYFLALLVTAATSDAQNIATNWAAFNDHRPTVGVTHANATTYDMRLTGQGGPLKDFFTGGPIPATLVVTAVGTPDDFGANAAPNVDTPAYLLFNGIVDVGNAGTVGVRNRTAGVESAVTLTFTNLDPAQRYIFAGTSVRGNNYVRRWTVSSIQDAASFEDDHTAGVYTLNNYPSGTLTNGQAAFNSGENRTEGALVRWINIDPGPDGAFSVRCDQWIEATLPNGQTPDLTVYGYSFTAIYLAEVGEPYAPILTDVTQPTNRVVLQSRPTTLTVFARGSPAPTYQWFKDGVAIDPLVNPSARTANYVITQMAASDAGNYHVEIVNSSGSTNSRTAVVGYLADTVAPRVVRATGSPSFDKVHVEFDEVMDSLTVTDAVNYAISPPLGIIGAELVPGGRAVVLTTDPQAPDTLYTVTALNAYDLAGNNVAAPNNTAQFRSWIPAAGCSGVLFEAFSSTGTTIPLFTNSPTYPNNPFTNALIRGMHSRMAFPDNANENYGGRMRALFIPLVSGNWRLFMSSDDPGELWFNPNGGSPAGRQRVAFETACCNLYQPAGASQTSPAFPLVAGQGYYIELIYKENTGGDYGMVAARLDGAGTAVGGNDQGAETGEAISGTVAPSPYATVGYDALPPGAAGTLSIGQNLSNISTEANRQVTLNVGASAPNSPFICYQWQKSDDGITFNDIPGATRSSYTTPHLTQVDDNGDIYRVVTGIPGSSITSATATLTVTADITRPRITRIVPISATQIAVYFSEPMPLPSSATDAFSYEIDQGILVGEAIQNPTNILRVDLTLSTPMTIGNTYTFRGSTTLTQLVDPSGNPLDPNPTLITFRSVNFTGNPDAIVDLPTNSRRPIGSLTQRGFAVHVVHVPVSIVNSISVAEQMLAGTFINPATGQPATNMAATPNFIESNVIDYYGNGTDTGHVLPNGAVPNLPSTALNIALEVLTYLELQPGLYRMGVNSDDNFRVSPATSVADPNNAITIGTFDVTGGRAQADTFFEFSVPEAGLYPFRLVFEQGAGGWGLEWFIQSMIDGSYTLVNGSDEIKAFVPSTAPRLTVARNAGNVTVSWAGSGTLQQAPELTGPWTDSLSQANPQTFNPQGKLFFRIRP